MPRCVCKSLWKEEKMTYRDKAERAVEIAEVLGGTFLTMVLVEGLFKLFI